MKLKAGSLGSIIMLILAFALPLSLVGCRSDSTNSLKSVVIYSGRSEVLIGPAIELFEETYNIKAEVKYAGTGELAATLLEEGDASPADVFFAQDPGGLGVLEPKFEPLSQEILSKVPEWAQSSERTWVGISGRQRVAVYNSERISPGELPSSIWGFTDQKWKGRIGWAPRNASFQSMITAMRTIWGEDRTSEWLRGIAVNEPKEYPKNTPIVAAAASGEIDVGFVNHYYLHRFIAEEGEDFPAKNHYMEAGDPGGVVLVAGAGILKTSQNSEEASRFLEFLLSQEAQEYFADNTFEFPVMSEVRPSGPGFPDMLAPLTKMEPRILTDLEGTVRLLQSTGVLP